MWIVGVQGIAIQEIDCEVDLLLGNNVPKALQPTEVKGNDQNGPYVVRTALGWTVNGPLGRSDAQETTANFIRADRELENLFKCFCDRELNDVEDRIAMSCEDKQALSVMKESIKLKDGHYELALPWKNPPPWNRPLVERRLSLLKKRLENDDQLLKKYSAFMNDLFEKGYARKGYQTNSVINEATPPGIFLITLSFTLKNRTKYVLFSTALLNMEERR